MARRPRRRDPDRLLTAAEARSALGVTSTDVHRFRLHRVEVAARFRCVEASLLASRYAQAWSALRVDEAAR